MCSSTSYIKRGKGSNILMYVAIHPQHQTYKQTLLCHPGFFLYHPEFKGTHAEGAGEAQCGIHGDHYSRVTTAAGWRRGRFFFFFLLHHTCVVTRVITTRQTEWDYFWLRAYSIFPSDFLLLHSSPLSLCLTPCHPVSPALGLFFFFFSCCGDQYSLFCPSQSPLFYYRFKHHVLTAIHTVPSGQLLEQHQVTLYQIQRWGMLFYSWLFFQLQLPLI